MAKSAKKSSSKRPAKKAAKKSRVASRSKVKTTKSRATAKKSAARKPTKSKRRIAKTSARRSAPRKSTAERAHDELVANARRALELKNAAPRPFRPENRTTNEGMAPLPNQTIAPEGALEAEGGYPAMERSHKPR